VSRYISTTCEACGLPFFARRDLRERGEAKFCSRACYRSTTSLDFRPCPQCQTPFRPTRFELAKGEGKYCGRICAVIGRRESPVDRFWRQVQKGAGCWLWLGLCDTNGYGRLFIGPEAGNEMKAHRFSWELHCGPIPEDQMALHQCDTPPCVNYAHLYLGTNTDNMRDRARRGRQPRGYHIPDAKRRRGEESANAKLTAGQVREIRARVAAGETNLRLLAEFYGITRSNVSCIVRRKSWAHLD
jgi:hypothetical protein